MPYPEIDFKLGVHSTGWALMSGEETLVMGADLFMDGKAFDEVQEYLEGLQCMARQWQKTHRKRNRRSEHQCTVSRWLRRILRRML